MNNILRKYGRIQSITPVWKAEKGGITFNCLNICIIKENHYKLNKNKCKWIIKDTGKNYSFTGKLIKVDKVKFTLAEYQLTVKCSELSASRFMNNITKNKIEVSPGIYLGDKDE